MAGKATYREALRGSSNIRVNISTLALQFPLIGCVVGIQVILADHVWIEGKHVTAADTGEVARRQRLLLTCCFLLQCCPLLHQLFLLPGQEGFECHRGKVLSQVGSITLNQLLNGNLLGLGLQRLLLALQYIARGQGMAVLALVAPVWAYPEPAI